MLHASALLLTLLGQAPVAGAAPPKLEFRLEVGIRTYDADGARRGFAGIGADESGFVVVRPDLCAMGASGRDEFQWPGASVWRVKSERIEQGNDVWLLEVEWQRVREDGRPTPSSPTHSRRLYLRVGDSVTLDKAGPIRPATLDSVQGTGSGACKAVEARLEASLYLWPAGRAGAGGARAGGGTGGTFGVRGGGGGSGGAMVIPAAGPPVLSAELWLVHTRPDGMDEARRLQLALLAGNTPYEFAPMPIDGLPGKVSVQVKGTLRPTYTDSEITGLDLMIDRRILSDNVRGTSGGGAFKRIALPKPMDVVGIEMPPAGQGEADLLAGHQFSLRLRVSPAK